MCFLNPSAAQASSQGYSAENYSDGRTNNVHTVKGTGSTLTLKENAKWVDSSNGIEKTAADQAHPVAIAEAKVSGEITAPAGPAPEYEFSGEIAMDMMANIGDALSDKSTYVAGAGIGMAVVGVFTADPFLVGFGMSTFNTASTVGEVATGVSAANDFAYGDPNKGFIKAGSVLAGKAVGGAINTVAPVSEIGKVGNAALKGASGFVVEQAAEVEITKR
jgi:hypothetical protein